MKRECSYIELWYLVQEWQDCIGSRISKVVVTDTLVIFELYKSGGKKFQLNIMLPIAWMGDFSYQAPLTPPSFAAQLRKIIEGARVEEIRLVKGERMIALKCNEFEIVIQLFSKGNVFVLKEGIIQASLRQGSVGGCAVRTGDTFVIEEKQDPLDCKLPRVKTGLKETLAKIGLGKTYAQEVLLRSGDRVTKVKAEIKKLFAQKAKACVVRSENKIIDITPFPLQHYAQYECDSFDSFNAALHSVMQRSSELIAQERVAQAFDAKVQRLTSAISAQELHLAEQKVEAQKNQELGELMYENYNTVKEVLDVLQQARKKYSWDEIKSRLKNHPIIKEVDEKKGKIVVELKH